MTAPVRYAARFPDRTFPTLDKDKPSNPPSKASIVPQCVRVLWILVVLEIIYELRATGPEIRQGLSFFTASSGLMTHPYTESDKLRSSNMVDSPPSDVINDGISAPDVDRLSAVKDTGSHELPTSLDSGCSVAAKAEDWDGV